MTEIKEPWPGLRCPYCGSEYIGRDHSDEPLDFVCRQCGEPFNAERPTLTEVVMGDTINQPWDRPTTGVVMTNQLIRGFLQGVIRCPKHGALYVWTAITDFGQPELEVVKYDCGCIYSWERNVIGARPTVEHDGDA